MLTGSFSKSISALPASAKITTSGGDARKFDFMRMYLPSKFLFPEITPQTFKLFFSIS